LQDGLDKLAALLGGENWHGRDWLRGWSLDWNASGFDAAANPCGEVLSADHRHQAPLSAGAGHADDLVLALCQQFGCWHLHTLAALTRINDSW
jgi:hypothetical protein